MPDTRPMTGAETGAKPHNPPTSCGIPPHHADNMLKPPVHGDGFRPFSLSTPCRKAGSCRTVPDAILPRNFAPRFCSGTGTTLSPFPVDNSVNSAPFPFNGNHLHPLPVKQAFPPHPSPLPERIPDRFRTQKNRLYNMAVRMDSLIIIQQTVIIRFRFKTW